MQPDRSVMVRLTIGEPCHGESVTEHGKEFAMIIEETCTECSGDGTTEHPNPGPVACYACNGHGIISAATGRAFKSQKTADDARRRQDMSTRKRVIRKCWSCEGSGFKTNPARQHCYGCHGHGKVITWATPGDVLPEWVGITDHVSREAAHAWADAVTVDIQRHDGTSLTWGASTLGIGTVYACTDYGRAWEANDSEALRARVREGMRGSLQWCKITDRETRRIADYVAVHVTSNGYAVVTDAAQRERPALPPTYTAEVLNAPTA